MLFRSRLISDMCEAIESAFLVVILQPEVTLVDSDAIDRYLKPILMQRYAGWADAEEICTRYLDVFKTWLKVGHHYRHGSPLEQIHEPPLGLAIAIATQGMGILRYLIAK